MSGRGKSVHGLEGSWGVREARVERPVGGCGNGSRERVWNVVGKGVVHPSMDLRFSI